MDCDIRDGRPRKRYARVLWLSVAVPDLIFTENETTDFFQKHHNMCLIVILIG